MFCTKIKELARNSFHICRYYFRRFLEDPTPIGFFDIAKSISGFCFIIAFVYFGFQITSGLNRNYVVIEPFDVASELINNGYTGRTIVNMLLAEMEEISSGSIIRKNEVLINTTSVATPDIVIPGPSNTIRALVINIKQSISKPLFIISGSVVKDSKGLKLLIRVSGNGKNRRNDSFSGITSSNNDIDEIIVGAARTLYFRINPAVLAGYFHNSGNDNAVVKICKSISNPEDASVVYYLWSCALFNLHNYDEALNKIDQVITIRKNKIVNHLTYSQRGTILRKLGRYDEAIEDFEKSMEYFDSDPYPYLCIGDLLLLQERYPETATALSKGIELAKKHRGFEHELQSLTNVVSTLTKLSKTELDKLKTDLNRVIVENLIESFE